MSSVNSKNLNISDAYTISFINNYMLKGINPKTNLWGTPHNIFWLENLKTNCEQFERKDMRKSPMKIFKKITYEISKARILYEAQSKDYNCNILIFWVSFVYVFLVFRKKVVVMLLLDVMHTKYDYVKWVSFNNYKSCSCLIFDEVKHIVFLEIQNRCLWILGNVLWKYLFPTDDD